MRIRDRDSHRLRFPRTSKKRHRRFTGGYQLRPRVLWSLRKNRHCLGFHRSEHWLLALRRDMPKNGNNRLFQRKKRRDQQYVVATCGASASVQTLRHQLVPLSVDSENVARVPLIFLQLSPELNDKIVYRTIVRARLHTPNFFQ